MAAHGGRIISHKGFNIFSGNLFRKLKEEMNTLVRAERAAGNWDKYKQIIFFGMPTESGSLQDWKEFANATNVNSTEHIALTNNHSGFAGFYFDGVSNYLDTNIRTSNFPVSNVGMGAYVFDYEGGSELFGAKDVSRWFFIGSGHYAAKVGGIVARNTTGFNSSSFYSVNRVASNSENFRINGAVDKSDSNGETSIQVNQNITIAARNEGGTPTLHTSMSVCYFISYKAVDFDHAASYTNWSNFLTNLGIGYNTTVQGVIDKMTNLSIPQKNAINKCVNTLVDSGDWAELDSFIVHVGLGSEENSIIDWKGTQDALRVNSPGWTNAGGFSTDGSTSYLNYQKNVQTYTKFSQNDAGAGFLTSGAQSGGIKYYGGFLANCRVFFPTITSIMRGYITSGNSGGSYGAAAKDDTLYSGLRNVSTEYDLYEDGVYVTTRTANSLAFNESYFCGCCYGSGGTPTPTGFLDSGLGVKAFFIGSSSINHANINTAIRQFQTDLGI